MPWLLNEDAAIKAKLSGVQVTTPAGPLEVPVRWKTPEPENETMTYPVIVISKPRLSRARDREARGFTRYDYVQEGKPMPGPDDRWGYYGERPIPYNLDYQVTVMCRLQAHETEIAARLARGDKIPERGGFLEIDPLNVVVSLDLIGGPEFTDRVDTHEKRLFTTNYVIRVYTELSPWDVQRYEAVETVSGTIRDFDIHSERPGPVLATWQDTASDV
ncbi:hypothetical protein GCM10010149_89320 [Nonomuraea roseoviolacea subsp. roseoviolacea]|uniref:hypothetical protein n=1 Tax=Nonomuraea roseoviolacea TaxID=103837 RepID=UPI0031CEC510